MTHAKQYLMKYVSPPGDPHIVQVSQLVQIFLAPFELLQLTVQHLTSSQSCAALISKQLNLFVQELKSKHKILCILDQNLCSILY